MVDINRVAQNHRTIRSYLDKEIEPEILKDILLSAQALPTSNNAQDYSLIIIKDKYRQQEIADVSKNPQIANAAVFIVFVADFHKTNLAAKKNHVNQEIQNSLNGIVTTTLDAGIGLGALVLAAEAVGLGVSVIGGIRTNSVDKMCEILNLPQFTFPLVGVCLGYPNVIPEKKPRLPLTAYAFKEEYNNDGVLNSYISEYDEIMSNYLTRIGRKDKEINWSVNTSNLYKKPVDDLLDRTLKKQGFNWNNK